MSERETGDIPRRTFLASTCAVGLSTLAGCTRSVDTGGGDGGTTDGGGDGGTTGGGSSLTGEVIIKGSSTVFPVSDTFAENFIAEHGNVNVTVDSTGSGGGFQNHFCPGEAGVNGASRPITDSEVEQCQENGVEPVEFQIASDALTVAVNNDADWVDCVTIDELSQIWREDGADRWSAVNSEWPDEPFALYGPAETSGTYDWFNENVVGEEYRHTAEHQPTEEDDTIVQGIQDNTHGMGYFGYAYYDSNPDLVKALEVDSGDGCTPPSLENARDGSYPLARPLYIYVAESALQRDAVAEFVRYYLENATSETVSDIGYVPASDDLRDQNVEKLENLTDE